VCGRYTLKLNPGDLARQLRVDETRGLLPRYNIAPSQAAPIVTAVAPHQLTIAQWGLVPTWSTEAKLASRLVNARAETLSRKLSFRDARRCLVPCDGFYEWSRHGAQRTPHYFHPREPQVLTMAGLYAPWTTADGQVVTTFTIVTTRANEAVRALHDRMPVFLEGEGRERWLSGEGVASLGELLGPWRGALASYQVEPHVNQVGVDDASCLAPARVVQLSLL
jgi:putative SOS response-associated peptidase YedK